MSESCAVRMSNLALCLSELTVIENGLWLHIVLLLSTKAEGNCTPK